MKFRTLQPDEIECRIGTATEKGVSVLLYKTSRTDMAILDETVGAENWKTEYTEIHGNLFCTLTIKCLNEWVGKQDCGIESKQDDGNEKKAEASDALKRAGFLWGIGRELYSAPFIWLGIPTVQRGNKWVPKDRFYIKVSDIEYTDGKISFLVLVGRDGRDVYHYGKSRDPQAPDFERVAEGQRKAALYADKG